jgi:hypothetical protein
MKSFAQLFEERRGVVDNGAYVRTQVPELLEGTNLALREGMPSAPPSDGALIGIAFYSLPDLIVLDGIAERSRHLSNSRNTRIEIFDILTCKSMQDVEALFSGLTPIRHPIIGVWAKGELIQKGSGVQEAQRIAQTLFT